MSKEKTIICLLSLVVLSLFLFGVAEAEKYNGLYKEYQHALAEFEAQSNLLAQLRNDYNDLIEDYDTLFNIESSVTREELLSYIEPLKEQDPISYLIQYKEMCRNYPTLFGKPALSEVYSQEQIQIIYQCVETETYQADFMSKVNVACVILNRVNNDLYPTDPIEIITSPNQFAYHRTDISNETKLALDYAYLVGDTTFGCLAFRSDSAPQYWCGWTYQFTDEVGHNFYK